VSWRPSLPWEVTWRRLVVFLPTFRYIFKMGSGTNLTFTFYYGRPSSDFLECLSLVDLQLAQNSYLFTYNTFIKILYMFRALPCSSSGGLRRNCIYAASGIVTLCRWLSCAPVKKELFGILRYYRLFLCWYRLVLIVWSCRFYYTRWLRSFYTILF